MATQDPRPTVFVVAALLLSACDGGVSVDPTPAAPSVLFAREDIDPALPRRAGDPRYYMPESMGPGVGLLDYDNDGRLDIYLCRGETRPDGGTDAERSRNRLYRQLPDGSFQDVAAALGVDDAGYGMGVAMGDVDGDGFVDVYVTNVGVDRLYQNVSGERFVDVTETAGISNDAWSAAAGFGDLDGDGDLDLFVSNYLAYDPAVEGSDSAGRPEYSSPAQFAGVPDRLFRNDGGLRFTDVSASSGIGARPGRGLGVVFGDLDGDGRTDIYVANDGEPNFAWLQLEAQRFTERAVPLGLAVNVYGLPEASMGIACGDVDGDGDEDLFLTHLVEESNTLYERLEGGGFDDRTSSRGLAAASIDRTGFGTAFVDVELDGDLDVVIANGRVLRRMTLTRAAGPARWAPYQEPNQLFLNDGAGRFHAESLLGGPFTGDVEMGRGLAVGDIDADGDVDLVVSNGEGTLRLYRNRTGGDASWLSVRAVVGARDALGAQVTVAAGERRWTRRIDSAGSYASSHEPRAHFGLGAVERIDALRVHWPDGTVERFDGGAVDRRVTVVKGKGGPP